MKGKNRLTGKKKKGGIKMKKKQDTSLSEQSFSRLL